MARPRSITLWLRIRFSPGCWLWMGPRNACGYGRAFRKMLAHRAVWEMTRGPIPNSLCVLHHCDNPACVRPDHLYLGTQKDNARDRKERGREGNHKGEAHGRAKLTDAKVLEIRARYVTEGVRIADLAREYQVSPATIYFVIQRKTWTHI